MTAPITLVPGSIFSRLLSHYRTCRDKVRTKRWVDSFALGVGFLFAVALMETGIAQAASHPSPVRAWVQRYSNPVDADDEATRIVTDLGGNVIVAGYSDGRITGRDIVIIKYSPAGAPLWTNYYNGPASQDDYPTGLAVDAVGNVFITGYSGTTPSTSQYVTLAFSASGNSLWTNHFFPQGFAYGVATGLAVDRRGDILVTGYSLADSASAGYCTIKYSGTGLPLWTNLYQATANYEDRAMAITTDASGNVFVTGYFRNSASYDYCTVAYSETGVALWTNVYGVTGESSIANSVVVDRNGNVFVAGSSFSNGYSRISTLAYSGAGVPIWTNSFSVASNNPEIATPLTADNDGNIIVAADIWTIAYSGVGLTLWTNLYSPTGIGSAAISALGVDINGDIFAAGLCMGSSWVNGYATVKYSKSGIPLWTNFYTGSVGSGLAKALAVDSLGRALVTGASKSDGSYDFATVAYSEAGTPLWTNRYNASGNGTDYATAVVVDFMGHVVATGSSVGNAGSYDYATVAYSSSGFPLWTNRYDGPANGQEEAAGLVTDSHGSVFVTGSSVGNDAHSDFATIKYSSTGASLWTNRFNGDAGGDAKAVSMAIDGNGRVFVTGWSDSLKSFPHDLDYVTLAYSSTGVPLWTNVYDGSYDDYATAIAVDSRGHVFVTGNSWNLFCPDYVTIAYAVTGEPLWTNRYVGNGGLGDFATGVAVNDNDRL
jgi:uncharacterized delta-60 repeat protein